MSNTTHEDVLARLSEYYEGELSGQERARCAEHIAGCAECRDELELLTRTVKLLGALSEEPAPASLRAEIMQAIEADTWWRRLGRAVFGEGRMVPARALVYVFLAVFMGVALAQFPFGSFEKNMVETGRLAAPVALETAELKGLPPPAPIETVALEQPGTAVSETKPIAALGERAAATPLDEAVSRLGELTAPGGRGRGQDADRLEAAGGAAGLARRDMPTRDATALQPAGAERERPVSPAEPAHVAAADRRAPLDEEAAEAWGALEAAPTPIGGVEYTSTSSGGERGFVADRLRERLEPKPEAQFLGPPPHQSAEREALELDDAKEFPQGIELHPRVAFSEVYGGVTAQSQLVLHDAGSFAALWNRAYGIREPLPLVPAVDFDREFALAAFLGQRPSGGFKRAIESVQWVEDRLVVYVNQAVPDPGSATTLALTQPFQIVILPRQVPGSAARITRHTPVEFVLR